ncbi:MAG: right-handed parallel beta-helix repeat-containing protein, partial [Armatimonadetes bacterium]|nr:right-handed parallel beta-helix repeat-containing protein [Armatimonadota bacterium]
LEAYALSDDPDWTPVTTELPRTAEGRRLLLIQAENFTRFNGKQLSTSGTGHGSKTEFHYKPGTFKPSWAKATDAEVHVFQSGDCRAFKEIVSLAGVDEKTCTVRMTGKECTSFIYPGDRYFAENLFEELDSPGEWYLNTQTGVLYYRPKQGFSGTSEIVAPVLGRLFELAGDVTRDKSVSYLTLSGLTIRDTDYSPEDSCSGYGMGHEGVVHLRDATHCRISDCTFHNTGRHAVCVDGGGDNTLNGSDISDSAQGGILLLSSARNSVSDNHIHHLGAVYKHVGGVVIEGKGADDNTVSHNDIHDSSRYGISIKNGGLRNVIEFNRVLNTNLETFDTGGIEVTQHDKELRSASIIRNNIVGDTIGYSTQEDGKPVYLSWGIYLDSYAGGYTVTNNIVYRSNNGGIMLQGGKDNLITNNIFVDGAMCQGFISNFDNNSTGQVMERNIFYWTNPDAILFAAGSLNQEIIRVDNNLYYVSGGTDPRVGWGGGLTFGDWQKQGFDTHSLIADPLFVDLAKDDYSLKPNSPALELGFEAIDISQVGPRRR